MAEKDRRGIAPGSQSPVVQAGPEGGYGRAVAEAETMNIYPDTTFFVALRFFNDTHHETATAFFEAHSGNTLLWSPWHRVAVGDALRTAYEISAEHAFGLPCRSADLLHVAYAKELAADAFVSFDDEQIDLA